MANLTKDEAKRILSNTAPDKAFWVNNGPVIKNIMELATAANSMTTAQFVHHVNSAKNDFTKWVSEVVRDTELAQQLKQVKTKKDLTSTVTNRLKQLKAMLK